jgi:hypothetical protein
VVTHFSGVPSGSLAPGKPKEGIPEGRKKLDEGSAFDPECHRNWRFYKLWLLIRLSFAILTIKAATGKRSDDQEEQYYKAWKVYRVKSRAAIAGRPCG